jgi:hypothetical protein
MPTACGENQAAGWGSRPTGTLVEPLDVPSIDQLELARTVIASALLSLFQLPSSRANPFQEAAEPRGRETTAPIIRAPQRRCFARTIC